MISSRWPRPIGIIESIALMPVCRGSLTGWRSAMPGAMLSRNLRSFDWIGPRPSSGRPSGSTTRPTIASPTGTDSSVPVQRASSPSLRPSQSPMIAMPTESSSRFSATPYVSVRGKWIISAAFARLSP